MELEFYFILYLFLSLIYIWQPSSESLSPPKNVLSVIPTGIEHFEKKKGTDYEASDKHLDEKTHCENWLAILLATEYSSRNSFKECS